MPGRRGGFPVADRGKIEAVINNAQRAGELAQETGTLAA